MVQVNYYNNYKNWYIFAFYFALVSIIILSVTPHSQVVHTAEHNNSFLWDFASQHDFISKLAYIGEELFGKISDKIRHLVAFLTLSILFDFSYKDLNRNIKLKLLIIYGIFIEIIQTMVPYREFGFDDILFNVLFILFYFKFLTRFFYIKEK